MLNKKQSRRKTWMLLLVMSMLIVTALSGCGNSDSNNNGNTKSKSGTKQEGTTTNNGTSGNDGGKKDTEKNEEPLPPVTLNIVYPGDPQPDQEAVNAAIEEAAAADGLNIKVKYQYIPWGDFETKVSVMLTAGDNIDILWTHPVTLPSFAKMKALAPLDQLIEQYGPDIKANIDAKYWPPVQIAGTTYGIPAGALGTSRGYAVFSIRKDLREKYGLAPIKTMDDLMGYFAAVKKNNPEMIVINGALDYDLGPIQSYDSMPDGVVIDWDTKKAIDRVASPKYMESMRFSRELYLKGYIDKDIGVQRDRRMDFNIGKAAAAIGEVYEYNNFYKSMQVPGAEVEFVRVLTTTEPYMAITTWNFQSIPAASKNKERAIMFLNWIQKDPKNYDLMTLGIEGRHYQMKDGNVELPEGKDASNVGYTPYEWMWQNPKLMKAKGTDAPDFMEQLLNFDKDTKRISPFMGFTFDQTPVKTEIAAVSTASNKYGPPLVQGSVDPEVKVPEFAAAMKKAGIDKVIAEVQKQLDAYMAANPQ